MAPSDGAPEGAGKKSKIVYGKRKPAKSKPPARTEAAAVDVPPPPPPEDTKPAKVETREAAGGGDKEGAGVGKTPEATEAASTPAVDDWEDAVDDWDNADVTVRKNCDKPDRPLGVDLERCAWRAP